MSKYSRHINNLHIFFHIFGISPWLEYNPQRFGKCNCILFYNVVFFLYFICCWHISFVHRREILGTQLNVSAMVFGYVLINTTVNHTLIYFLDMKNRGKYAKIIRNIENIMKILSNKRDNNNEISDCDEAMRKLFWKMTLLEALILAIFCILVGVKSAAVLKKTFHIIFSYLCGSAKSLSYVMIVNIFNINLEMFNRNAMAILTFPRNQYNRKDEEYQKTVEFLELKRLYAELWTILSQINGYFGWAMLIVNYEHFLMIFINGFTLYLYVNDMSAGSMVELLCWFTPAVLQTFFIGAATNKCIGTVCYLYKILCYSF